MTDLSQKVSKNFTAREYACKCGCGLFFVEPILIEMVQELRERLGRPLKITSGVRCSKHNKAVGGARHSYHVATDRRPCRAVDLHAPSSLERYEILKHAFDIGFSGIGIDSSFVHADCREGPKILFLY